MLILIWLSVLILSLGYAERPKFEAFNPFRLSPVDRKYATFTEADMEEARNQAKEMYYFAYNNYMKHAYPADELDPINCKGRGHDHANPQNININDVLGDYSLTLVDGMGTLAVMGDVKEFHKAVRTVIRDLSFNKNTTVQVFEATIRVMGPLLSAHLLVTGQNILQGDFTMKGYNGELLALAKDLANRLMPAFRGTATGLPFTRVNLQKGVLLSEVNETCTAGAGSLLLEFGILSRLTGDETYEAAARGVNDYLWSKREGTGLPGSLINIQTGEWTSTMTGVGAGSDSYYELMLKAHILFGDKEDLNRYNKWYAAALRTMRRGRYLCARGIGEHPIYVNVDARDGTTANTWVDSLQASFAGVLTLAGDIEEAVCAHALHYGIWRRFGVLPERFDYHNKRSVLHFYPLRPELAESTYYLYLATKNPFYLHVGREIMDSINTMTRVKCGFATVHDVHSGGVEDRMESFFVAETMKYLYLLFDPQNLVNKNSERLIFSTEGHIFPILEEFQRKPEEVYKVRHTHKARLHRTGPKKPYIPHPDEKAYIYERAAQDDACDSGRPLFYTYRPVLVEFYMELLFEMVGLNPQWWS